MNLMYSLRLFQLFCASLIWMVLFSSSTCAAVISFSGGGPNENWSNGANWSSGLPPTAADLALITNNLKAAEVNSSGAVAEEIEVRNGGVLNVTGGDLTFGLSNNRWLWVGFLTPGTVNQSGGIVRSVGNNTDLVIDQFGSYNMTGGTLNLSDDLWLLDGAQFSVSGQSVINVGDDLRLPMNNDATFHVNLVDSQEPTIVINDDLVMRGGLHLEVDTSAWTGGTEFTLFQVNDGIIGQFASLTVDGVVRDPSTVQFNNGAVVVPVNEPATGLLAGIVLFWIVLASPIRRRLIRPRGGQSPTTLQGMHAPRAALRKNSLQTIPTPAFHSSSRRKPTCSR